MSGNKNEDEISKLHPRNKHLGLYDFKSLTTVYPELSSFVKLNTFGNESISFFDPKAVKSLNSALLKLYYRIDNWDIPEGYLCPPIPGRADYIHNLADLINHNEISQVTTQIKILDIGVGANCIYPIIGSHEYGWKFTGVEIDEVAYNSAQNIITANQILKDNVELRYQNNAELIFFNVIKKDDYFEASMCNPPFHSSAEEAMKGSLRKTKGIQKHKNIKEIKPILNFGGQAHELWCAGGEAAFIHNMIIESVDFARQVNWFTTLVSKETNLPKIYKLLEKVNAKKVQTINMSQGNKTSRIVAWTYN